MTERQRELIEEKCVLNADVRDVNNEKINNEEKIRKEHIIW